MLINSERGFVLITAALFLIILTIIGIAATNTTYVEMNIAGNERIYKQNFYLAEGAVREAASEDLNSSWVWKANDIPLNSKGDPDLNAIITEPSDLGADTFFGAIDNGIPIGMSGSGHSLKVNETSAGGRMHFFDLYGKSTQNNSIVIIAMGYKKRL